MCIYRWQQWACIHAYYRDIICVYTGGSSGPASMCIVETLYVYIQVAAVGLHPCVL